MADIILTGILNISSASDSNIGLEFGMLSEVNIISVVDSSFILSLVLSGSSDSENVSYGSLGLTPEFTGTATINNSVSPIINVGIITPLSSTSISESTSSGSLILSLALTGTSDIENISSGSLILSLVLFGTSDTIGNISTTISFGIATPLSSTSLIISTNILLSDLVLGVVEILSSNVIIETSVILSISFGVEELVKGFIQTISNVKAVMLSQVKCNNCKYGDGKIDRKISCNRTARFQDSTNKISCGMYIYKGK